MSNRIKLGDTVRVVSGKFAGQQGTIETRRGTCWVVVFSTGGNAQLMASALRKVVGQ